MGLLVNVALAALAGVAGGILASTVGLSQFSSFIGLLCAVGGFFAGNHLAPVTSLKSAASVEVEWEDDETKKKAKKERKAAAEARKKAEAAAAREREAEEKKAKKAEKAAAAKAKQTQQKVESESESESEPEAESEPEPVIDPKTMSKSALKKAKQKAKELAAKKEAEAAAKAAAKAAKKAEKETKQTPAAAPAAAAAAGGKKKGEKAAGQQPAPTAAEKAAAAAAAADLDGWETIEPTKPTKSQLAAKEAASTGPKGKYTPTPTSERLLTEDIHIPAKSHALIVGPKGAHLNLLQTGSGAQIEMPKLNSGSTKIQVTGTPAQVYAAKNAIQSLHDRGYSHLTHPGTLSDDITVEGNQIGVIVGSNGATLRTIQEATSTRINLPEKGSNSKKVTIVGEKENVKAAKAALKSLLADGFSTLTHPNWVKIELTDFPADKYGVLIGPKGHTIKSLQGQSGARINLPEKGAKDAHVSIVGTPEACAKAQKDIAKLLEPLEVPEPEDIDLATEDAWGQEHTAQGEDALW